MPVLELPDADTVQGPVGRHARGSAAPADTQHCGATAERRPPQLPPPALVRALSANVTLLDAVRLDDVLDAAEEQQAALLCLQETRHPAGGFAWATLTLNRRGWRTQWSPTSGLDAKRRPRPGGLAPRLAA